MDTSLNPQELNQLAISNRPKPTQVVDNSKARNNGAPAPAAAAAPVPVQAAGAAASVDPTKQPAAWAAAPGNALDATTGAIGAALTPPQGTPVPVGYERAQDRPDQYSVGNGLAKASLGSFAAPFAVGTDAIKNGVAALTGTTRPDAWGDTHAATALIKEGGAQMAAPLNDALASATKAAGWTPNSAVASTAPGGIETNKVMYAGGPAGTGAGAGAGRGSVNPAFANPDALQSTGAPNPNIGTVTKGGKTFDIGATSDMANGGGYAGATIGQQPIGPLDSYGNSTARTTELKGQLAELRANNQAETDRSNELNRQSMALDAAASARDAAKTDAWEQKVANSSILNRPSVVGGTAAQMQAQTAAAQLQNQMRIAQLNHQGAIRGQDITARGQDLSADTAIHGQRVQARGQDLNAQVQLAGQGTQVQVAGMNNQQSGANAHLAAATQAGIAEGNNATSRANTKDTVAGHTAAAEISAKAARAAAQPHVTYDQLGKQAFWLDSGQLKVQPLPQRTGAPKGK